MILGKIFNLLGPNLKILGFLGSGFLFIHLVNHSPSSLLCSSEVAQTPHVWVLTERGFTSRSCALLFNKQ